MRSSAQSFTGYGTAPLIVDLVPSHRLLGLVLAVHAAAALPAVLWPHLLASLRIGWIMTVGALCYRELLRQGWTRSDAFVHRFGRAVDGRWFFEVRGARYIGANLTDRLVGPGLCVLRLSAPGMIRTLVVLTDATDEASHRRLRAALLAPQPSADGRKVPPSLRR